MPGRKRAAGRSAAFSHAREKKSAETDNRVREIVRMMCEFEWKVGRSSRDLAEKWGINQPSVEALAAQARRHIALSIENPEDMRAKLMANLQEIVDRAMQNEDVFITKDGDELKRRRPDYKAAVQAANALATIAGLNRLTLNLEEQKPAIIISKAEDDDEPPASPVSPPSDAGSQA